jgi:hypothetical protein
VEHFHDEHSLEELSQLFSDRPVPLFDEATQPLLHGTGVR